MRQAIQGGPGGVRILQTVPVEGTLAEMAADAAAIILAGTEVANQGKRWENTTDGLVYVFGSSGGSWDYYPESGTDINGYINVSIPNLGATQSLYTPARDIFEDFFFGTDSAKSSALTAGSANIGIGFLDMREINTDARSIVIQCEAGCDYDYKVYFSRTGLAADRYEVAANLTNTTEFVQVNIPASLGYDKYIELEITPDGADSGTQLTFKAYLVGRGG